MPIIVAVTETKNAFREMPARTEDLGALAGRLDEIRQANVDHPLELIADAARHGARAIGLGELFAAPYFALSRDPMWHAMAEPAEDGATVRALAAAAKSHGIVIVAPIYEKAPSGKRYNTAVVIDADGTIAGKYRKTHKIGRAHV
jgi:N-carbamoylputrescine amidase